MGKGPIPNRLGCAGFERLYPQALIDRINKGSLSIYRQAAFLSRYIQYAYKGE
jgi:hypothetical protein